MKRGYSRGCGSQTQASAAACNDGDFALEAEERRKVLDLDVFHLAIIIFWEMTSMRCSLIPRKVKRRKEKAEIDEK